MRVGQSMAARPKAPETTAGGEDLPDRLLEDRLAGIERRLAKTEVAVEARQRLDQPAEERIARLETRVDGQASAITELRECSLRNEETVRRLLGSLERLIESRAPAAAHLTPEPAATRTS
jgi:uncharacterized coiled-coil protein SlyX